MVAKDDKKTTGSPKVEVGEIDTSAPFQSVKDAVNLFGEGAFSGGKSETKKPKPHTLHSADRVLAKETQLHLKQKELDKLQEQLKNAENTKVQAHEELERAKRTIEDLTLKLKIVSDTKDSAVKATEAAKNQARQLEEAGSSSYSKENRSGSWKLECETARAQYTAALADLDAAKQELRKMRQNCNASADEKAAAIKQEAEAEKSFKSNTEKAGELSKEISAVQESIHQLKLASLQVQEEETTIYVEKDVQKQSHKAKLEESAKKLAALRKEIDPQFTKNLESQLAETISEIESLQKMMDTARSSDLDSVRAVTTELDDAKESLHKVAEEESSLRALMENLKLELESVKREHSELKEKELETESLAGNLHVKLRKAKSELEAAIEEEAKARGASEEMISTLHQLTSECENAKREEEEMRSQVEAIKKESESIRVALEEAEKKLEVTLGEAEEAKAAEAKALEQIKILSERTSAARASTSDSGGAQITLSKDEFDSLSRKVVESEKLSEMKVTAAMAQVEAVRASENEALKRLEATQKEIDDIKTATQEALKRAEMAEAAKKAVEGELKRWREREQKKAIETASRILAERQVGPTESSSPLKGDPQEKVVQTRKLEKVKTSVSKKVVMPNLSGMFQKRRNQVEGGSPSYLPGETPD